MFDFLKKGLVLSIFPLFLSGCLVPAAVGLLSGGDDDGGSGGGGGSSDPPSPSVVYMWVTSATEQTDFGGVNAADTLCETEGSGMNFNTSVSEHKAVIATSTYDPSLATTFFSNNPPIQRPDGTNISSTYTGWFDSSTGTPVDSGNSAQYFTGLNSSGNPSSENCNDWTFVAASTSVRGTRGRANNNAGGRFGNSIQCITFFNERILCISY